MPSRPVHRLVLITASSLVFLCTACASPSPSAEQAVAAVPASWSEIDRGGASYYADKFVGRETASGEVYTHRKLTAAHRTLPFGTRVRVTRLDTGAEVVVRINDRGPFKRSRIIDLSRSAAERLDMLEVGVVEVEIEVLGDDASAGIPSPKPRSGDTSTSW